MILYFSGTGNSGYAARRIADGLGDAAAVNLNDRIKAGDTAPGGDWGAAGDRHAHLRLAHPPRRARTGCCTRN